MKTSNMTKIFIAVTFLVSAVAGISDAQETITINGIVKKIDLSNKTAVVSTYEGELVTVIVEDKSTLNKFEDGRIMEGDEIKVRYKTIDGKNIATYFKKPVGC